MQRTEGRRFIASLIAKLNPGKKAHVNRYSASNINESFAHRNSQSKRRKIERRRGYQI